MLIQLLTLSSIFSLTLGIKGCAQKYYNGTDSAHKIDAETGETVLVSSFVCVCDKDYCDEMESLGELGNETVVYYTTTLIEDRFWRREVKFGQPDPIDIPPPDSSILNVRVQLFPPTQFQTIHGFGGAFTDAASIQFSSLSDSARQNLYESYFGPKGNDYTLGRVPIASCDFSTRMYSYCDTEDDFSLNDFKLDEEDTEYRIPIMLKAVELSGNRLKLVATPWSAPGWMKENGKMEGGTQLKEGVNGRYYETWAQYFVKFFEEYQAKGVPFWALTIQNEPYNGLDKNFRYQNMFMSYEDQRDFAYYKLRPALDNGNRTKEIRILAHDDNRRGILEAALQIYNDSVKSTAIDGLAVHWYSIGEYEHLTKAHMVKPEKFILGTEACTGWAPSEQNIQYGDWQRGEQYGLDIIGDLRNWVTGWIDWNLALDTTGGPNWVNNFVDAAVIVNQTADEFYKQPMYYFIGHFSRFVPPGSVRIDSRTVSGFRSTQLRDQCKTCPIQHVAFRTPEGNLVLVVVNRDQAQTFYLSIGDVDYDAKINVPPKSVITAVWREHSQVSSGGRLELSLGMGLMILISLLFF